MADTTPGVIGAGPLGTRRVVIGIVLGAGIVAAVVFLSTTDLATRLAEAARRTGTTGVIVFFIAYVVSTVALLPGSILTLAAGFAYGPVWGLVFASPASVAGATCAFLLGRTLLRGWVERKIGTHQYARAFDAAMQRHAFKLVVLLRLSPLIPFDVLNYVFSLTAIPLRTYVLGSFIGMLPGTLLYVYLGSLAPSAAELASSSRSSGGVTSTVLYVVGLIATIIGVVIATRTARRALATELGRS